MIYTNPFKQGFRENYKGTGILDTPSNSDHDIIPKCLEALRSIYSDAFINVLLL